MKTQCDIKNQVDTVRAFLDGVRVQGPIRDYKVLDDGTCEIVPWPALDRIRTDLDKYSREIDEIVATP